MIDFSKYSKYSKAGPRYTSYPTAPEFNSDFNEKSYIEHLKNQNSDRDLSLYFHLPFCKSACYFCGCSVVFTSKEDKKTRYIEYLEKELKLLSKYVDTNRAISQLHFGGGTPTFFDDKQLKEIIILIKKYFNNFKNDSEISCEIDPRYFTKEQCDVLVSNGFNRFSFGVQDFDEKVQKAVHRIQDFKISEDAINLSRESGVNSINIDLIYGLPYQSLESFKETLRDILILNPDRLAVFNYAHVPWMKKTMRKIDETTLPEPSEKLAIMQYTAKFLCENGYKMIGMDHFAKPTDELFLAIEKGELHRNFQGYTTKGNSDLIGVGLTSISDGENFYSQNYKNMKDYERALDEDRLPINRGISLDSDDLVRKYVIMELMANFKLDIERFNQEFKIDFFEYFKDDLGELDEFIKADLISIDESKIDISETGTLLIRNIVMPFDKYLKAIPTEKRKFSKTV